MSATNTLEAIEKRKNEIKAQKKALREAERSFAREKSKIGKNHRICVAIVGSFLSKIRPAEFAAITSQPEFDQFLNRDSDRLLFGLPLLGEGKKLDKAKASPTVMNTEVEAADAIGEASEDEQPRKKGLFG